MRILVFGDSITQGFYDEVAGGWCNRLITEVMKRDVELGYDYDRAVINLGISGDTTSDVLRRVKMEIEARVLKYPTSTYDVALIAIGVNDTQYDMETGEVKLSAEETESNLLSIIKICQDFKIRVVLIGPASVYEPRIQPMAWKPTHGYSNTLIKERSFIIEKVAALKNCEFVSMLDVYEGKEENVLPDGIHPNAAGHAMLFGHIKTALENLTIL